MTEMGERVARRPQDRDREAGSHPEADPRALPRRRREGRGRRRPFLARLEAAARWRASSSRRCTSSRSSRRRTSSSTTSSRRSGGRSRGSTSSYAKSKNLTPYDVLKIASMIEKETVAPKERKLVAAVIYNRLRNRMPLGIDATIRYGLEHPGHEVADEGGDRERQPVQQPSLPGPAADADREPGPRVDQGRSASGRASTTSTTSASPARRGTSSRRARASSCARCASSATPATDGTGSRSAASAPRADRRYSAGDRDPRHARRSSACSAGRRRTRCRRRCRTRASRRSGSTGPTSRCRRRRSSSGTPCAGCARRASRART